MRVVSLNVGMPRLVRWQDQDVWTGIFKSPVSGPVAVRKFQLDGDGQADLSAHGGPDKAVYAYPLEHYDAWAAKLARKLEMGVFGENLTTTGLLEDSVRIGDEFRVGSARLAVTQPRIPCFKLGIRFGDPLMVKRFLSSGWPGIYFTVLDEGQVRPGDHIELTQRDERGVTVSAMMELILNKKPPRDELERVLSIPNLSQAWRTEFRERLSAS